LLSVYPDREAADILYNGFRYGFRINYAGPRVPYESRNLKSVLNNPAIAWEKVMTPYVQMPVPSCKKQFISKTF
jgi:hypothetical protein